MNFYVFSKRHDRSGWNVAIRTAEGSSKVFGKVKLTKDIESAWGEGFRKALRSVVDDLLGSVSQGVINALGKDPDRIAEKATEILWERYRHDFEKNGHVELAASAFDNALWQAIKKKVAA